MKVPWLRKKKKSIRVVSLDPHVGRVLLVGFARPSNRKVLFTLTVVTLLICCGMLAAAARDPDLERSDAELKSKLSLPAIALFDQTEFRFLRSLKDHFIDVEIHRVKASSVPRTIYDSNDAAIDIIGDPDIKEIGFYGRVESIRAKDHDGAATMLSAALGAFCDAGAMDISRVLETYSSLYVNRETKKRVHLSSGRCSVTFEPPSPFLLGEYCTIVRRK